jgi:hypothetical protein
MRREEDARHDHAKFVGDYPQAERVTDLGALFLDQDQQHHAEDERERCHHNRPRSHRGAMSCATTLDLIEVITAASYQTACRKCSLGYNDATDDNRSEIGVPLGYILVRDCGQRRPLRAPAGKICYLLNSVMSSVSPFIPPSGSGSTYAVPGPVERASGSSSDTPSESLMRRPVTLRSSRWVFAPMYKVPNYDSNMVCDVVFSQWPPQSTQPRHLAPAWPFPGEASNTRTA